MSYNGTEKEGDYIYVIALEIKEKWVEIALRVEFSKNKLREKKTLLYLLSGLFLLFPVMTSIYLFLTSLLCPHSSLGPSTYIGRSRLFTLQ